MKKYLETLKIDELESMTVSGLEELDLFPSSVVATVSPIVINWSVVNPTAVVSVFEATVSPIVINWSVVNPTALIQCDTTNDIVSDPLSNFIVDCNKVTVDGMPRNIDAYRYQDKGVGHFGVQFRNTLDVYFDSTTDDRGICYVWSVSNVLNDGHAWTDDGSQALGLFFIKVGSIYQLRLRNHETYVTDILNIQPNKEYSIVVDRIYGQVDVSVYDGAALVGVLFVPVSEEISYRYFYRVNSYNSSSYPTAEFYGYVNNFAEHFICVGDGGLALGGSGDSACSYHAYSSSGGIAFGGTADAFIQDVFITGDGGIAFGGEANVRVILSYEGKGGIALGGDAEYNYNIRIPLQLEWNVASEIVLDISFAWDVESDVKYWFRIESECVSPNCDWTGTDWNDPRCETPGGHIQGQPIGKGNKYVQILPARSVRDLCVLISNADNPLGVPNLKWKIKSITRYNLTMRKSDLPDGVLPECITLEEMEFCQIPECMEFCLESMHAPNVSIGATTFIVDAFYSYVGSGGVALGGSADYRTGYFPSYLATGGIAFGGSADITSSYYKFTSTGGLSLGGSAGIVLPSYQYESDGGLALGGTAIDKPSYKYLGDGGLGLSGVAGNSSDWGIWEMVSIGATPELSSFGGNFEPYDSVPTGLTIGDEEVVVTCGCGDLLLRKEMLSNWGTTNVFYDFLKRNSIQFPERVGLLYHELTKTWKKSYHYTGISSDAVTNDRWDLLFQWSCTNDINGETLAEDVWKFSAQIARKNLTTGQDFYSKIIFAIEKEKACANLNNLGIAFSVDTETGIVVTNDGDVLDYVIMYDEIGLFRGPRWLKNPYLEITISEFQAYGPWPKLDISPIFSEQPLPVPY